MIVIGDDLGVSPRRGFVGVAVHFSARRSAATKLTASGCSPKVSGPGHASRCCGPAERRKRRCSRRSTSSARLRQVLFLDASIEAGIPALRNLRHAVRAASLPVILARLVGSELVRVRALEGGVGGRRAVSDAGLRDLRVVAGRRSGGSDRAGKQPRGKPEAEDGVLDHSATPRQTNWLRSHIQMQAAPDSFDAKACE